MGGSSKGSSGPSALTTQYNTRRQEYKDAELRSAWETNQNIKDANAYQTKSIAARTDVRNQAEAEKQKYLDQSKSLWDTSRTNYDIDRELESRSGMDVFSGDNLFKKGADNVDSSYNDWYNAMKTKDPSLFDSASRTYQTDDIDRDKYVSTAISGVQGSNVSNQQQLDKYFEQYDTRASEYDQRIANSDKFYADTRREYDAQLAAEKGNLGTYDKLTQDWKDAAKGYATDTVGEVGRNLTYADRGGVGSSEASKDITKVSKDSVIAKKAPMLGFAKSKTLGDDEESSTLG